jgi:hypothetical protein
MRTVGFSVTYFAGVFAIGFALGVVRVTYVVPAVGERAAELAEMPIMVAASVLLAWRLVRHWRLGGGPAAMAGLLALGLLVGAELAVALGVRGVTLAQYLADRDPVAGIAYVVALGVFMLAPAAAAWLLRRSG